MPTERRRWTSALEEYRAGAEATAALSADDAARLFELIRAARALLRSDPDAADILLAEALGVAGQLEARQRHIINLMLLASIGRE